MTLSFLLSFFLKRRLQLFCHFYTQFNFISTWSTLWNILYSTIYSQKYSHRSAFEYIREQLYPWILWNRVTGSRLLQTLKKRRAVSKRKAARPTFHKCENTVKVGTIWTRWKLLAGRVGAGSSNNADITGIPNPLPNWRENFRSGEIRSFWKTFRRFKIRVTLTDHPLPAVVSLRAPITTFPYLVSVTLINFDKLKYICTP